MPRKPKIIYEVYIYQDPIMKFWSMVLTDTITETGFPTKEYIIEYCNKKGYIIKGEI